MKIYLALIHYPVLNRQGEKICSAITNLDIHDIARASATYGVEAFFVVTPSKEQQELAKRVMAHWLKGAGARFNPDRKEAFLKVKLEDTLSGVIEKISKNCSSLLVLATSARRREGCISWKNLEKIVQKNENKCILFVFGTASGLHEECIKETDGVICPIEGVSGYNHLSVRSAVAITLDRISRFRRQ